MPRKCLLCAQNKSVRQHRASAVSFSPSSLLCEWALLLPLLNEPLPSMDTGLHSNPLNCAAHVASRNATPTGAIVTAAFLCLQAAFLSHCTHPQPSLGGSLVHKGPWHPPAQLGPTETWFVLYIKDVVSLRVLWVSCTLCIHLSVFCETTFIRFCLFLTAVIPLEKWSLKARDEVNTSNWKTNTRNCHVLRIYLSTYDFNIGPSLQYLLLLPLRPVLFRSVF